MIVGVGGSATTDGGLGALRAIYPPQRLRGRRADRGLRRPDPLRRRRRRVRPPEGRRAGPGRAARAAASSGWPRSTSTSRASTCRPSRAAARPVAWPADWRPSAPSWSRASTWWPTSSASTSTRGGRPGGHRRGLPRRRVLRRQGGRRGGGARRGSLGVPVLAVVGEVVEPPPRLPEGLTVVSLTERFGADDSLARPGRPVPARSSPSTSPPSPPEPCRPDQHGGGRPQTLAMTSSA